jgi:hypothetical protein
LHDEKGRLLKEVIKAWVSAVIDSQQIRWMEMESMDSMLALGDFPAIEPFGMAGARSFILLSPSL